MSSVTRYVITHINTEGERVMSYAHQGRNTFATPEEAAAFLALVLGEAAGNDIPGVWGRQAVGTFEVRPVECWLNFDPKTRYFEEGTP